MGGGYHGGFGNTQGAARQNVPVNASDQVRYNRKKTVEYLLNTEHPKGGSKAVFLKEVLGYTQADSVLFHKNVVSAIIGKEPVITEKTPYGIVHTYRTKLIGRNDKSFSANVVVVIQLDNGSATYRIITVFPGKKEK